MPSINFLSYRTSKARLFLKVRPMSRREFNSLINPIIAECRHLPITEARNKKYLQSNEVVAFLQKIGEPVEDYGKPVEILSAQRTKKHLRQVVPFLSDPVFVRLVNQVMAEWRSMKVTECLSLRTLREMEVRDFLRRIGELV